jgi:hypothetical protein
MFMTIAEKCEAIENYCRKYPLCSKNCGREFDCPLYGLTGSCYEDCDDETVEKNFKLVSAMPDYDGKKETVEQDIVNHPSHYCQEGQMECIDEMVMFFGKETVKAFCLCNAWKYRYRANSKNGAEDLKKAAWYVHKYRELSNCE